MTVEIAGFDARTLATPGGGVFVATGGDGPPVLLLHGFPETHLMWRDIAPRLAERFAIVCADLPGYGRSDPPADGGGKRQVAARLVEAMATLGHSRFAVVGHDRGGRVAYRMALDHPEVVTRLAVLDVVPSAALWARADARLMLSFWPFSLLPQPAPLPERLILGCPEAVVDDALGNWGTPRSAFPDPLRDAYVAALRSPAQVHAICEDYRAAAAEDRTLDEADAASGRRIGCPLLALWSAGGGLDRWYADEGGPPALWRELAGDVTGEAVPGGHFFPEEDPAGTAARLNAFLAG